MNVADLIVRLQQLAAASTNTFELMVLAKSIEKIRVGGVITVATFGDLPTLPLTENGQLFLVEADEQLYYNIDEEWEIIKTDIAVSYAWGRNTNGQLGDGTAFSKSSPVIVVGGITNWAQLSASETHSLGVTDSGIAYAWGAGAFGRLGDGTTADKSSPVKVVGGITNWSQVSAGSSHSLGVTDSGIAYAWGLNTSGRLGDNSTTSRTSPVTVVGGITNWAQLSAGGTHSLGVTDTGIAYAWGENANGRLGDGTTLTNRSSPFTVAGGITNWSQLSAGSAHSLGVTDSGIAYAWGLNTSGRLGDNSTTSRRSPVTVVGGITNWSQLSAGSFHSLGVTDSGIAYAWGSNTSGRLGDNTTTSRTSPVTVVGGITNWAQLSAGGTHSLGVTDTGIAYAWGLNTNGQLGDDTSTSRRSPVTVVGGITNWSQLSAGRYHSLAVPNPAPFTVTP